MATSCLSLAFSISQGALEFVSPDESFHVIAKVSKFYWHVLFYQINLNVLIVNLKRIMISLAMVECYSGSFHLSYLLL